MLEERESIEEKKYAFETHTNFEIEAKASKLVGLWAAEKLGLSGDDAQTYAKGIVEANLEIPGFDDVLDAIMKDFDAKQTGISREDVCHELEKLFNQVKIDYATHN